MGHENKEFPNFSDPKILFLRGGRIRPQTNFEPIWYSRTLKKIIKGRKSSLKVLTFCRREFAS